MNRILPLALMVALGTSGMARADDDCPSPMANWQSRKAASTHVQGLGIRPERLKIDDGCYEVRGRDGDENRVQLKLDPATLALIELNVRFRPGADPSRYLAAARGQTGTAPAQAPQGNPVSPPGTVPEVNGN